MRAEGVEHRDLPPTPMPTTTMFGTTWPGTKFRFELAGSGEPVGNTVRNPPAVGATAVTLRATATAVAGIADRPVIGTLRTSPAPSGVSAALRVS